MLRIAVLGCGRIGQMHAANVARHPRAELAAVFDVNRESAERVALAQGVSAAGSAKEIFSSDKVDAVLIATATPTHADYIEMAVAAGKAVLCEKPIDLNLARVNACAAKIAGARVPIQLGFNRRYDPGTVRRGRRCWQGRLAIYIKSSSRRAIRACLRAPIWRLRADCSAI